MEQVEELRIYDILNVDKTTLKREAVSGRFVLRTEKTMFKKKYVSHIPVDITEDEWAELQKRGNRTYKGTGTPILHKIKGQTIKYLKDNNRLK